MRKKLAKFKRDVTNSIIGDPSKSNESNDSSKDLNQSAIPEMNGASKKKHLSVLRSIWEFSLNHFFITFISLYLLTTLFLLFNEGILSLIIGVVLVIYVIVFLSYRLKINIYKFLHHELGLKQILIVYITSVLFMIILFGIMYWLTTVSGIGYLRYGSCIDNVDVTSSIILNDPYTVTNVFHYPYFSAITFLTVGYGDICPMGAAKAVGVINAIIGSMFNALILAIAIMNYSTSDVKVDADNKNKVNKK